MEKRLAIPILFLLSISFVSAVSFSDVLDSMDESTVILSALFIIIFTVVNFVLASSFFKGQKGPAGITAMAIAFLSVYGLNRLDFDLEVIFFDIGISTEALYTLGPIIILAGFIYAISKFKQNALFAAGLTFLVISLTDLVYEQGIMATVGFICLIAGIIWQRKQKKN